MKIVIAAASFLLATSFPVFATDLAPSMDAFGIALGGEMNIPECEKSRGSYKTRYSTEQFPMPCWQIAHTYKTSVKILLKELPLGTSERELSGDVVEGSLVVIKVNTTGADSQKLHLLTLVQKYGEPHGHSIKTVETRLGVTVPKIVADWAFDDLDVHFEGVGHAIDRGSIVISTKVGTQLLDQQRQALYDRAPKL